MHSRIFSNITDLYLLHANSMPIPAVILQNISRYCQMPPHRGKSLLVEDNHPKPHMLNIRMSVTAAPIFSGSSFSDRKNMG